MGRRAAGQEKFEEMIETADRYVAGLRHEAERVEAFMSELEVRVTEYRRGRADA